MALAVIAALGTWQSSAAESGGGAERSDRKRELIAVSTGRHAELRETVPIANRARAEGRSVLSVKLPRIRTGDRIRLNGEVTATTTCVEQIARCIGRSYDFTPRIGAQAVLAGRAGAHGKGTLPVSRRVDLRCEQTRPNRNHHCPLAVEKAGFTVDRLRRLPCKPTRCRLNMILDAHNRNARGGEVVVVGADRPDGSVEGGKARIAAAISRSGARLTSVRRRSTARRTRSLPASFEGGHRVVYSQKLTNLDAGDVLIVRARQRTAIKRYPYFVSNQILVTTRRRATDPSRLSRRAVSQSGTVTETNGFNCTPGRSAFRSPCVSRKAGIVEIKRTPRSKSGKRRALYVNLISRSFPKLAQARGSYPPAKIRRGGSIEVRRLRDGR